MHTSPKSPNLFIITPPCHLFVMRGSRVRVPQVAQSLIYVIIKVLRYRVVGVQSYNYTLFGPKTAKKV